jgi:16S rRNA (guanine527-N7)-methyltransferase
VPENSLANSLQAGLDQLPAASLDTQQAGRLLAYLRLLHRWNQTYNLTSVRNPGEMISRHLLDSLSVLPWISGLRLLDAGTGAGLPGIPLAIARPGLEVTVLDSGGKKVRFLNHVVRELRLENVRPVQARLESFEPVDTYDAIISRAADRECCVAMTRLLFGRVRYARKTGQ